MLLGAEEISLPTYTQIGMGHGKAVGRVSKNLQSLLLNLVELNFNILWCGYTVNNKSAIGGCSVLGRVFFGSMYDYLGARLSLMICFATLIFSLIFLQISSEPRLLFLFALIYGAAHGGFFTVASPSTADFFGTRAHGIILGLILFVGTLGGTIGPLIAGTIFDYTRSYETAFLLLTGMAVFGLIVTSRLRPAVPKYTASTIME